jgi:nucleotide-binding universal stress UspA family protein
MRQITNVLSAIDFSDESAHALDHAIVLARFYGARITGVHVYTPRPIGVAEGGAFVILGDRALADEDRRVFQKRLDGFLEPARVAGVSVCAQVLVGRPTHCIVSAAKRSGADLIVLGTHGASGFERLILGSVAERVLRTATCPVLTVPPRVRKTSHLPFKRILCPVDFSEPSHAGVELAVSIASEGDADVTFLHVIEPGMDAESHLTLHMTQPITVSEYDRERESHANELLHLLVAGDVTEWCRPSTRISRGKAYREILGVATEDGADLIVMGVHGRNPVDVALFGSTTNHVVRAATCPVLTVRA